MCKPSIRARLLSPPRSAPVLRELQQPIITELTTFTVLPGKEAHAEEWMRQLKAQHSACVATLDREHMHHECIFRSFRDGRMRLTWFEVHGEGGAALSSSPAKVDALHMAFWRECIDPAIAPETFEHVLSLIPCAVQVAIDRRAAALHGDPW